MSVLFEDTGVLNLVANCPKGKAIIVSLELVMAHYYATVVVY